MRTHDRGDEQGSFRILSIDGGGIKGAFVAGYLEAIEERLGEGIGRYFDLIAGTSTGAIIAVALAFDEPAVKIRDMYVNKGPEIFQRWWEKPHATAKGLLGRKLKRAVPSLIDIWLRNQWSIDCSWLVSAKYGADILKDSLHEVFGHHQLGHARTRLVIPSVNVTTGMPKVFKTSHTEHLFHDCKMKAVDVIMASSAAPTYFPHIEIEEGSAYVDGGLWANNPGMVAVVESITISRKCRRLNIDPVFNLANTYMLSIGTGRHPLYAKPPKEKAGLLWWATNSVLDQTSLSQSAGINFQAKFVLEDRLRRVDFEIPDVKWTLDNASVVREMIHIGQQQGVKDVEELRNNFFKSPAQEFVPYEKVPSSPSR